VRGADCLIDSVAFPVCWDCAPRRFGGAMPNDTPLHKLANEGSTAEIEEFLMSEPDAVNAAGAQGRTPLHRALGGGFIETATVLLERKADPNTTDHKQRTSLHWAALNATDAAARDCIALLFDLGVGEGMINTQSQSGSTPLHCALSRNHTDASKLLVVKGADTKTIKDEDGKTCAQLAAELKLSAVLKAK
jgi:ankyrin repeat protein